MTLILKPPPAHEVPLAGWMDAAQYADGQRRLVRRAMRDGNHHESPLGSNRSPYLDALCLWAGSPLGSYWCAIWLGAVFASSGFRIPYLFPACDYWLPYLVDTKALDPAERVGCAILYGKRGTIPITAEHRRRAELSHGTATTVVQELKGAGWDGQHIGQVSNWLRDPYDLVLTTEGNRGYAGLPIGTPNNGIAIDTAPLTRKDVLGLIPWKVLAP